MYHSTSFQMRLVRNQRLTDPSIADVIAKLTFTSLPHETLPAFHTGQCVRLALPKLAELQPGYFALASSPHDNSSYEFVIKAVNPLSQMLVDMAEGATVLAEGPMGKGFDLQQYEGKNIIMMGVGTGIAPLRSMWLEIIRHRERFGEVMIYAGFLTAMHRLLTDELASLEEYRIQVSVSLTSSHDGWNGPVGFVQHALEQDAPSPENTVVCLAGMSAMVDACTESLLGLGFLDAQIMLNY